MDGVRETIMDIDTKERLAHVNDMGIEASAIRLHASRLTTPHVQQKDFADACGISKTSYNNMEKGLQFPNRAVMLYLFRAHRIDFNFLMNGSFSQLPQDVQDGLFPKLEDANNEWDQKSS